MKSVLINGWLSMLPRIVAAGILTATIGMEASAGWQEDFKTMAPDWEVRGKPGVPLALFRVGQPADTNSSGLLMEANNASASLLMKLDAVDLVKTPILRWRWRVTLFPRNADGRYPHKDDQAIGIYINTGSLFNQRSIAYRWETDTPIGVTGTVNYAGGLVKVKWVSLRNQQDGSVFFIEERNVVEDFQREFGFIPKKISLGISCNSQYTASQAAAELDWIEFLPTKSSASDQTMTLSDQSE